MKSDVLPWVRYSYLTHVISPRPRLQSSKIFVKYVFYFTREVKKMHISFLVSPLMKYKYFPLHSMKQKPYSTKINILYIPFCYILFCSALLCCILFYYFLLYFMFLPVSDVERACWSEKTEIKCERKYKGEECYCDTDECNGSGINKFTIATGIIATVTIVKNMNFF